MKNSGCLFNVIPVVAGIAAFIFGMVAEEQVHLKEKLAVICQLDGTTCGCKTSWSEHFLLTSIPPDAPPASWTAGQKPNCPRVPSFFELVKFISLDSLHDLALRIQRFVR